MKLIVTTSALTSIIIVWSLVGFPAIAAVTSTIGISSTTLSVLVRGIIALASIIVVLKAKDIQLNWIFFAFILFWIIYFLKLSFEFGLSSYSYSRSWSTFWIWSIGACFLPAFAVAANAKSLDLRRLYIPLLFITVPSMAVLLLLGSTNHTGAFGVVRDIGRLNVDSLNPISMGHLGVSGVLVGIAGVLEFHKKPRMQSLCAVSISLGLTLIIFANSRGPIVAMVVALILLMLARIDRRRTLYFAVALAIFFVGLGIYFTEEVQFLMLRFSSVIEGNDMSTVGRVDALTGALAQFQTSPLFGDRLEERSTQFYPHNVIAESFMATGIFGGLAFLFIVIKAMILSWSNLRSGPLPYWVSLLTIQYIIGAQFSGALYQSTAMWASMMLISISIAYKSRCKVNNKLVS